MKKLVPILLALIVCISTMTACGTKENTAQHTFQDLTIHIPTDYIDLSDEEFASDLDFVYGLDPIAVNGLRENKSSFQALGFELTLEDYGKLLCMSNNVNAELKWKNDILTFSYNANGYTYVVTLWETEEAFWTVQAYCPTESYSKVASQMWEILSSVEK